MYVHADPVLLGNPIKFTITLKRKTDSYPKDCHISGSLELQTYMGKNATSLGILHKTTQRQGQGTGTMGKKRDQSPHYLRCPSSLWTISIH